MNRRMMKFTLIATTALFSFAWINEASAGWPFHRCRRSQTTYYSSNAQMMTPQQMQREFDRQEGILIDILTDQINRHLGDGGFLGGSFDSSGVNQKLNTLIEGQKEIKGAVVNNASILQAIGQEVVTVNERVTTIQKHLKMKTDEESGQARTNRASRGNADDRTRANKKTSKKKKPTNRNDAKPPKMKPIEELTATLKQHVENSAKFHKKTANDIQAIKAELDKKADKPVPPPM